MVAREIEVMKADILETLVKRFLLSALSWCERDDVVRNYQRISTCASSAVDIESNLWWNESVSCNMLYCQAEK
jgi:hypothetical protein